MKSYGYVDNDTEVEFTEAISVKKILFKPFVKAYLKSSNLDSWKI